MSSPAGPAQSPVPIPPALPAAPATDPTGFDAIESLYRRTDGAVRRGSGVRPFEPALRVPENSDGYGWLYRPLETVAAAAGPAVVDPVPPAVSTTSGVAVLDVEAGPDPVPAGLPVPSPRRWPAVLLLLAAALGCAVLLLLLGPVAL